MIAISEKTFSRAAQKAAAVQPAIRRCGGHYHVSRADGGVAIVRFQPRDGRLWAECSCPAGNPSVRRSPQPCYHIAAVLLQSQPAPAPAGARLHSHACPRCGDLYACRAGNGCELVDDVICDSCDRIEIDRITWSGLYGSFAALAAALVLMFALAVPVSAQSGPPSGKYKIERDGIALIVDTRGGTIRVEKPGQVTTLTGLQITRQGCKIFWNLDRADSGEAAHGEIDLCAQWGGGYVRTAANDAAVTIFDVPVEQR